MTIRPTRDELLKSLPGERWTYVRKLNLVFGIHLRIITTDEAIAAHELSRDELNEWLRNYARFGAEGLRLVPPGLRRAS